MLHRRGLDPAAVGLDSWFDLVALSLCQYAYRYICGAGARGKEKERTA